MAVKTIYTCDRCKHEQDKPDQMWRIGVVIQPYSDHTPMATRWLYNNGAEYNNALWCRKCVDGIQLLGAMTPTPSAPAPKVPTLEERIRDILLEVRDHVIDEIRS